MESDRLSKKREVTECLSSVMDVLQHIFERRNFTFTFVAVDIVVNGDEPNISVGKIGVHIISDHIVSPSETGQIFDNHR